MTITANKIRLTLSIIFIIAVIWFSFIYPEHIIANLDNLKKLSQLHPILAPLVFIGIYILITLLVFLPVSFLTLLGGWLFGALAGSIFNIIGALAGAALAFLVSRYVAGDWVANHIGHRLKLIRDGVSRAGWRFVALVRLAPILPFNLLNCALGLTEIRFRDYILATAMFMLPAKIAYTYVGSLGFEFIMHPHKNDIVKLALLLGVAIAIGFIPWVIKYFRQR